MASVLCGVGMPMNRKLIHARDGAPMVLVPEGTFIMGTDEQDVGDGPAHSVMAPAFYMDVYHVTNRQYKRFLDATGYAPTCASPRDLNRHLDSGDCLPVVYLNWHDAAAYAAWAGKRLPTEVQWEKAARGTDGRRYPWGNQWDRSKCCCTPGGATGIMPVGSFPEDVSPYGCFDMAGNVGEWLRNWMTLKDYRELPEGNSGEMEYGNRRCARGGNWFNMDPLEFACATRGALNPDLGHDKISFRCVLELESAHDESLI